MSHKHPATRTLALAFSVLVVIATSIPALSQTAPSEGYDPLRQITAQLVKANLLIVQDVTGSMAYDIYSYTAPNGQHAHGRLNWETLNKSWGSASNGTVRFLAKRVSTNASLDVTVSNIVGVGNPGIYTWTYPGSTGPQFQHQPTGGTPIVYATSLPVLVYESGQYRLAYKCEATGTWTEGGKVPWSKTVGWYYNTRFNFNKCSTGWARGLYFTNPSRIMTVKNALGNSVYIGSDYTPPAVPSGGVPFDRWANATWNAGWSTWVSKGSTPAGPIITYTEAYKTMGADPASRSYKFEIEPGYELSDNKSPYDPTFKAGLTTPKNASTKVNWISDPNEPFPAFHTAAAPYNDMNGDPVRSPGLKSDGTTEIPAGNWSLGWPTDTAKYGTVTVRPPSDIIGKNASRVNFGLMTFSSSWKTGTFPYLFPIDVNDTNNVERLQAFLAAREDPNGTAVYSKVPVEAFPISSTYETKRLGLSVTGGTNTKVALEFAKTIIQATFDGGDLADNNNTWKLPADPKKTCQRTYGVILVTDGMSNTSNPNGGAWVDPSVDDNTDNTQRVSVDTSRSESNCPDKWSDYAAQKAHDIFSLELNKGGGVPVEKRYIYPRTWAIGISPLVGPCELDMIAYMGRTDASSPSGDAGFGGYHATRNPWLPKDTFSSTTGRYTFGGVATNPIDASAGTYDGPTGDRVWAPFASLQRPSVAGYPGTYTGTSSWTSNYGGKPYWQHYRGTYKAPGDLPGAWEAYLPAPDLQQPAVSGEKRKPHGHNAYFANNAQALSDAFAAIVNATATGDYATNAPVSGMSATAAEADIVFLPSTGFPNWRGHLYAFDTKKKPTASDYQKWDAGELLTLTESSARKIFTWNPADNSLVEVNIGNLTEAPLKSVAGMTPEVIDFIRGNDGAGNPRTWRLGPMVNSAPAIVARPGVWTQNTVVDHKPFQVAASSRDSLLWVGSNDGMLHAFRSKDGVEQIAIIPPSLLWKQVTLYNNFLEDPTFPSGQPPDVLDHVYGVSNSFRFGDVYFPSGSPAGYRTVGIVTLGAGGTELFAMDVTSVPKPDAASYPTSPVSILWAKTTGASSTGTTLQHLAQTYSIPAMAPVSSNTWRLVGGSGYNPDNKRENQGKSSFIDPRAYVLDPVDGTAKQTFSLSPLTTPAPFVGSQAFADAVLFDPKAKAYQDDNVALMGLQADLNGQIWFLYSDPASSASFNKAEVGIDVSTDILPQQSQPIYFNPAASGYGTGVTAGCVAYAFGSGALYERSTRITGSGIGTHPSFVPRLYLATGSKSSYYSKLPAANISPKVIAGSWTVKREDGSTRTVTFGKRTQMTGAPFMLVPKSGKGTSTALYLLYDPDEGCNGFSYVAIAEFEGSSSCTPTNVSWSAYEAGVGAASGFTIAGDKVLVSKSGIGEGERAGLYIPPNISAAIGGTAVPKIRWWKELK